MNTKQLIIIGGGSSIQEGIQLGLWEKLQNKLSFGLNYSFNFYEATAQLYVDEAFYLQEQAKLNKLPLVIGQYHRNIPQTENLIMLPCCNEFDISLKKGVYNACLCGLFSLSVALHLQPKEIFLLGYDFGAIQVDDLKRPITHFYQGDINHRGIGKTSFYEDKGRQIRIFSVYPPENIYNVSLISKIPNFEKIEYKTFFEKLDDKKYNQEALRQEIKTKLKEVPNVR